MGSKKLFPIQLLIIFVFVLILLGFIGWKLVDKDRTLQNNTTIENNLPELIDGIREGDVIMTDGARLHYWFYDRGTDTVTVYLHGGPGSNSSAMRTAFGTTLSDALGSILFYDQRGSGDSEIIDDTTYTFQRGIQDLSTLVQTVAPNNTIILWGHSFGGTLAVMNASSKEGVNAQAYILDAPWLNESLCVKARKTLSTEAVAQTNREHFLMASFKATPTNADVQTAWQNNENLNTTDFLPLLSTIHVPVLVIGGSLDSTVPTDQIDAMKAYLPNAFYVRIPNAAHNAIFSHTTEFISELQNFLLTITTTSSS